MRKERLLIVSDYFYPHWTGISRSIYNLIESLSDSIDISVLTIKHKSDLLDEETVAGARVQRVSPTFALSRSKYSFTQIGMFIKMIQENDVVLINTPSANVLILAIITKLFHKKLLIFHQGDLLLPKGVMNRVIESVFYFSMIGAGLLADRVGTYTYDYAVHSVILKYFLHKFSPVILPINIVASSENTPQLEVITAYKKQKKQLIGFAGRFVEEKGFDVLFDAIPEVVKEVPSAHFVFAGEIHIGYEKFFEQNKDKFVRVKEYVTNFGLLPPASLKKFYQSLDLLAVPSRSDCFNLVQAEAMLLGVPVVVSNIPGARFLVQKTGFGKIFEKENSKDLAEKIVLALHEMKSIQSKYKTVGKVLDNKKNVESVKKFITS